MKILIVHTQHSTPSIFKCSQRTIFTPLGQTACLARSIINEDSSYKRTLRIISAADLLERCSVQDDCSVDDRMLAIGRFHSDSEGTE